MRTLFLAAPANFIEGGQQEEGSQSSKWKVGDKIQANWYDFGIWLPGEIIDLPGGLYTVRYQDGDTELGISEDRIKEREDGRVSAVCCIASR